MTDQPPVLAARTLPDELLREITNAHAGLAGRFAELFFEHTRAAYQAGYENGWNAGWEAADRDRGGPSC